MLSSESCRNCQIRLLQLCWRLLFLLPLTIAFIVLTFETFAEETSPKTASPSLQTDASKNGKSAQTADDAVKTRSASPANNNSDSVKTDKKTQSADDDNSEEDAPDPVETLNAIRSSYAKKNGIDIANDKLILSQSSVDVFLNRKKIRDIKDNNLDHWYFLTFEDDLNLTLILFESIPVKPLTIDLDADFDSRLSLTSNDFSVLNAIDVIIALNSFINFPIPESVLVYINENSGDVVDVNPSASFTDTLSSYNYVVLFLAILGFSILGFVVYRIVVWSFLLDQNPEHDFQKGMDEAPLTPVGMDAFRDYIYQTPSENRR